MDIKILMWDILWGQKYLAFLQVYSVLLANYILEIVCLYPSVLSILFWLDILLVFFIVGIHLVATELLDMHVARLIWNKLLMVFTNRRLVKHPYPG